MLRNFFSFSPSSRHLCYPASRSLFFLHWCHANFGHFSVFVATLSLKLCLTKPPFKVQHYLTKLQSFLVIAEKFGTSLSVRYSESIISEVISSQTSKAFAGDLDFVRNSGVSARKELTYSLLQPHPGASKR